MIQLVINILVVIFCGIGSICNFVFSENFIISTPVSDDGAAVLGNPAGLASRRSLNFFYQVSPPQVHQFGLQWKSFGFGYEQDSSRKSYKLVSGGRISPVLFWGIDYSFKNEQAESKQVYDFGLLWRPLRNFSLGLTSENLIHSGESSSLNLGIAVKFPKDLILWSVERKIKRLNMLWNETVTREAPLSSTLQVKLWKGLWLQGEVEWSQDQSRFQGGVLINGEQWGTTLRSVYRDQNHQKEWDRPSFALNYSQDQRPAMLKSRKRVAEIVLKGEIGEEVPGFSFFGEDGSMQSLHQILKAIRSAAEDPTVDKILIKVDELQAGLGVLEEIRDALLSARKTGKKTMCYLNRCKMSDYFLATATDEIIAAPLCLFDARGVSVEVPLYKGTLDKLGISSEFIKIGKYKSAPEVFTRDSLSAEFKENEWGLLKEIFQRLISAMAEGRKLNSDSMGVFLNRAPFHMEEARHAKLIDRVAYYPQIFESQKRSIFSKENDQPQILNYQKVKRYTQDWQKRRGIAVVVAQGTIIDGDGFIDFFSGRKFVGSRNMAELLKNLEENKAVRSVVIRIDSPGGSVTASDEIWQAMVKLKKKKPVIVSMGDLAASGGYYIACGADTIVADSSSLTGSIGIFTGKFVLKGLYDKIGYKKEILKIGQHADLYSDYRSLSDLERKRGLEQLQWLYQEFLKRVAEARRITIEKADSLAQGRVYTGKQAKAAGLVDVNGGLETAIKIAKIKAGYHQSEPVELTFYSLRKSVWQGIWTGEGSILSYLRRGFVEDPSYWVLFPWRLVLD